MDDRARAVEKIKEEIEDLRQMIDSVDDPEFKSLKGQLLREVEDHNRTKEELSCIFNLIPDMNCIASTGGFFKKLNPGWEKTLGYTAEELLSRPFLDFVHPDDQLSTLEEVEKQKAGQAVVRFENRYICKDGSYKWLAWATTPSLKGNLLYATARDITELKINEARLERELKVNKALAELSQTLISPGLTIKNIAEKVLAICKDLTESEHGYATEFDPDTRNNVCLTLSRMIEFPISRNGKYPNLCGHSLNTKGGFFTNSPQDHESSRGLPDGHVPLRNFLSIPVLVGESLMGQIVLANCENGYSEEDLGVVKSIADLYALAIERNRSIDLIKKSEAQFRNAFNQAYQFSVQVDVDGKVIAANDLCYQATGSTRDQIIGCAFEKLAWWKETLKDEKAALEDIQTAREGKVARREVVYINANGEERSAERSVSPVRDLNGKIVMLLAQGLDVTERKQANEALRKSKDHFRLLYEGSPLAYQSLDANGNLIEVNPAWLSLLGYEKEEVIGRSFADFLASGYPELFEERFPRFKEIGEISSVPFEVVRKDGSCIDVEVDGKIGYNSDGSFKQSHCVLRDVTERKMFEQELSNALKEWQGTFDAVEDAVWILDANNSIIRSNRTAGDMFQQSEQEMIGMCCCEIVHGTRQPIPECPILRAKENLKRATEEMKLLEKWFEVTVDPILGVRGEYVGAIHIITDITKRKQAEEALKLHQYYLLKAQEIGSIGTWELDIEKNILTWTEETYRIFGVPIDTELTLEVFLNCVHPDDREYVLHEWSSALAGTPYDIEHRVVVDGEVKWVREKAEIVCDENGTCIRGLGFAQDITKRRLAEQKALEHQEELAHGSRLSSMNQMAAGLAHEINQPLCAIASYAEGSLRMLKSSSFDSKELLASMEAVADQAHRAGEVIKNLREFVNRGDNKHSQEDICTVIKNSVKLIQGLAKQKDVAIAVKTSDEPLLISINKVQIEQVILNLIQNGFDAMIETEHDKCKILIDVSRADDENVQVSVTDSGKGFNDEEIGRIFRPFFTTKKDGLGIGLSITESIIEDHGGQLWAEQNQEGGAVFKFTLPIAGKDEK